MKRKISTFICAIGIAACLSSCYTLEHTVGNGAQGSSVEKTRQWYALWGLVPINQTDTKAMAGGAQDYTITTKHTFVDFVISAFTGIVTIQPKTVEVKK